MARYRTGNSAKDRRNVECDGYRNVDTAKVCIVVRNDRKCNEFVRANADKLLSMKKEDKLKLLNRKSSSGFGEGVSMRNVDYRELNAEIRHIRSQYK